MILLLKWFISALALLLAGALIPGISISSFYIALIVALFLGLLNALVRPLLIILTLPINVLTLGLFTLVINGAIFWFVSSFVKGFTVENFSAAILGALLVWIVGFGGNILLKGSKSPSRSSRDHSSNHFYHVDGIQKPEEEEKD